MLSTHSYLLLMYVYVGHMESLASRLVPLRADHGALPVALQRSSLISTPSAVNTTSSSSWSAIYSTSLNTCYSTTMENLLGLLLLMFMDQLCLPSLSVATRHSLSGFPPRHLQALPPLVALPHAPPPLALSFQPCPLKIDGCELGGC